MDADGVPRFANVAAAVGVDSIADGRGMAFADFDNDGDLDIVMNTNPGDCGKPRVPPVLYRNDLGQNRHWLAIELVGTRCNREALGAEVHLEMKAGPNGKPYIAMRHVCIGSGYASQNSHRLQFGLGDGSSPRATLTVHWPTGGRQTFKDVPIDGWVRITEEGKLESFDPRKSTHSRTRSYCRATFAIGGKPMIETSVAPQRPHSRAKTCPSRTHPRATGGHSRHPDHDGVKS